VTASFRIIPAGDAALIVEFADRMDPQINASAVALSAAIDAASIAGVRDVLPTYRSVAVHFDPLRIDYHGLIERLQKEASGLVIQQEEVLEPIRVPVIYGADSGPDLSEIAQFAGITENDVVDIHSSRTYRVFMLGFVPGFTYMGTVDSRIAIRRKAAPRLRVPAGSVGIAGLQTGIYPAAIPGGWQIVGRTPIEPYDPARAEPFLFKPGDQVRFYPIERGTLASPGRTS
jgi:KipI family sensor histidine kinase inhibitor